MSLNLGKMTSIGLSASLSLHAFNSENRLPLQ